MTGIINSFFAGATLPPTSRWDPATINPGGAGTINDDKTFAPVSTQNGVRGTQGYAANGATDLYFEVLYESGGVSEEFTIGLATSAAGVFYPGFDGEGFTYYGATGQSLTGGALSAYGAAYTNGDVIGVRLNNGVLSFYKNGVSQGDAFDLVGVYGFTTTLFYPACGQATTTPDGRLATINTGEAAFVGLPSGAVAWG